jgi:hypothetical protein
MKKKIFLLIAALAIVFANVVVACPPGYTSVDDEITIDECTYYFSYCYGINGLGLHEIILTEIWLDYNEDACAARFENYQGYYTNQILLKIAQSDFIEDEWNLEIPECPNFLCMIRWRDAICYEYWFGDKHYPPNGRTRMFKCDNEVRSCNETVKYVGK